MIPDDVVQEVKRRADLGAVVERYVKLRRQGKDLVGLCPFHREKTPSFRVHVDEGYYHCFGCGAAGDALHFLIAQTGQAFPDVVRALAVEVGVEVAEREASPEEVALHRERDAAEFVLDLAQSHFRQRLEDEHEGCAARAYLDDERRIAPGLQNHFGLGFGGARGDALAKFLGQRRDRGVAAGVLREGERGTYNFFRDRITFPIRDQRGRLVGFAGRIFGPRAERAPKYVNTPQTVLYDKGAVLYGLFEALPALKRGLPAVLVEGQLDVLATHAADFPAGVAPCGTALTQRHVEVLQRHTDHVVLCLDADAAGEAATERALILCLSGGLEVRLAELVEGDPDDLVRAGRGEGLRKRIENARSALDVIIERAVERAGGSLTERSHALRELLPFLAAQRGDELGRRQYLRRVARAFSEDENTLSRHIAGAGRRALQEKLRAVRGSAPAATTSAKRYPLPPRLEYRPRPAPQRAASANPLPPAPAPAITGLLDEDFLW